MFLLPVIILVIIIVFMLGFETNLLQGSIAQVLGSEVSEDSTDQYLLATGNNAASVILYNQFSDSDFDGLLDQEDEKYNKFAVVKFSPEEQVQFGGLEIEFKGVQDQEGELNGAFTINGEIDISVGIDKTTVAKKVSFVGREFYKQGRNEYAIIFVRSAD